MSQLKEISGQSNLTLENVICNMNITNNYWKLIKSPTYYLLNQLMFNIEKLNCLFFLHAYQAKSFFIDKVNSNAKLSNGDQIIC